MAISPDELDDTPDSKQSMAARLCELFIDPEWTSLTCEEFRPKEYDRNRDGTWLDDIPNGSDHGIDAVRSAMMDDASKC